MLVGRFLKIICVALLLGVCATSVGQVTKQQAERIKPAVPDKARVKPKKPRYVLVWNTPFMDKSPHKGYSIPQAEFAMKLLGDKTGAFQAVVSDDPRLLLGDRLPQFDALVMNNIHEPEPFLPEDFAQRTQEQKAAARKFDNAVKQGILDYVSSGKGIVGIHGATAAFQNWPEYGEMLGGYYGGHIYQEVAIKLDDPQHSVNTCFEGKPWRINDEIYIFREPYSRGKVRVVASLDLSRMEDLQKRPDKDYAVSWVRAYKGRVFYTTLGHDAATYWNTVFLHHLLAGVQFAIGDLEGQTTPHRQETLRNLPCKDMLRPAC